MNQTEITAIVTVSLLAAFALGWFAYWVLHRFSRVQGGDMGEVENLAQQLHEAEETRRADHAISPRTGCRVERL